MHDYTHGSEIEKNQNITMHVKTFIYVLFKEKRKTLIYVNVVTKSTINDIR